MVRISISTPRCTWDSVLRLVDGARAGTLKPTEMQAPRSRFDHRVADGAQVAGFLGELRQLIESPELALLDR